MSLTGRFDFQITLTGKMVLLVEEEVRRKLSLDKDAVKLRWRRAKPMDLASPPMRPLADLRFQARELRLAARSQPTALEWRQADDSAS